MAWTSTRRIADAIYNDVVSGLRGYHTNPSISINLLEQEVVETRLAVIKEYMLKGILPLKDLMTSINCVPVDCKSLDKCSCNSGNCGSDPIAHFLIPQLMFDFGLNRAIYYIGSTDKQLRYLVYTKPFNDVGRFLKYRKRGKNKPWIFIDITPNQEGLLDCYIFNAPLVKSISVTAIFKDLRLLEEFQCDCSSDDPVNRKTMTDENLNFIDTIVKERLTKLKLYYYRQLAMPLTPNDLTYTA